MRTASASLTRFARADLYMAPPESIRLFHAAHSPEMEQAALEVLRSGQIASGPKVAEFQKKLGDIVGTPNVVCTNDMTCALTLALHLAGVKPGHEVLTLAYSCMSSNAPIALLGAKAVWVDIDPMSASMSVEDVKRALSPRTKAVIIYHVAGYPGPVADIVALCRESGIAVIEDCNNALGASQYGTSVGRTGDFAVFSFYPNRQINAIEGGALVCPDAETARRATRLRRFGIDPATFRDSLGEISPQSDIPEIGWSASLSQLNAAVGLSQLPLLARQIERTQFIAGILKNELTGLQRIRPVVSREGDRSAYWVFLMLVERRDEMLAGLKSRGVHTSRLHHRNDDYTGFNADRRALPGTDKFMNEVLAIPCGWWLSDEQISSIVAAVRHESQR